MADIVIRGAIRDDLTRLTELYNYYVVHTPITAAESDSPCLPVATTR